MIFIIYLVVNGVVIYLFTKLKKKLHILEIIMYWMVASYLYQNFSALCYMNFKTLLIPEILSNELAHFINRTVLFPIIMVVFLHYYIFLSTNLKKIFLLSGFVLLLTGMEWIADFLGVIIHVNWQLWWSFAFWLAALLVLNGFAKFFRIFLFKGGLNR